MQLSRQANSTARARPLVDGTKNLICAITSAIKYPEPKAPSVAPPAFEEGSSALAYAESDGESALFYPTPPFARRFTSSSQHSGSTKSTTSTTNSSVFSRHTYQNATTAAGEGKESCLEKGDGIVAADRVAVEEKGGPELPRYLRAYTD